MSHELLTGRCELRLKELPDNSKDSIVTDPPYELGFMGKSWDSTGIAYNVAMWRECLRVLKPGGHLLAFGGSRTYHRLACAVEDAGFEIRDQIMWVYGSGFPKSMDVAKAIDKELDVEGSFGGPKSAAHAGWIDRGRMRGEEGHEGYQRPWMQDTEAVAKNASIYFPGSPEAQEWSGWGTALKPAHEPIVLARKPLNEKTVAANVIKYGVGSLNIGASRILGEPVPINKLEKWSGFGEEKRPEYVATVSNIGRWPANLIHDGSDEVLEAFPDAPGQCAEIKGSEPSVPAKGDVVYGFRERVQFQKRIDAGSSAARFFYCAKASREDRNEGCEEFDNKPLLWSSGTKSPGTFQAEGTDRTLRNNHPTVKPTDLMRYLCRLVTPPGGTVLDPFTGSGSTGKAAILEGFDFVGIEQSEEYVAIAEARIAFAVEEVKRGTAQQVLFA